MRRIAEGESRRWRSWRCSMRIMRCGRGMAARGGVEADRVLEGAVEGVEALELPTDYPRPAVMSQRGRRVEFEVER